MKKKDKGGGDSSGCPLWMMTFGDCMSLLVTFFVMLIAFTNTETDRLLDMLGGMRCALGIVPSPQPITLLESNASCVGGVATDRRWI